MNLRQLEAFIKVSDSKSFSKAAQELYLTQPTVSAHIQTLEKELKYAIKQRKINRLKYGGAYLKTYLLPDNSITQVRADITVPHKEITPLCVKDNGELVTPDSFKYCARVIHWELGNHLFHAHCLRHTHGTMLAEGGVNPKTVMERLGHKDIATTLQTYTFNTESMQQFAVDVFEKKIQA